MKKSYSIRETALMLDVKVRTVRDWISKGKLNAHKGQNGRYWRIFEDDIIKRMEQSDEDKN